MDGITLPGGSTRISALEYAARAAKLRQEVEILARQPTEGQPLDLLSLGRGLPLAPAADDPLRSDMQMGRGGGGKAPKSGRRPRHSPVGMRPQLLKRGNDLDRGLMATGGSRSAGSEGGSSEPSAGDSAEGSLPSMSSGDSPIVTPLSLSRAVSLLEAEDLTGLAAAEAQFAEDEAKRRSSSFAKPNRSSLPPPLPMPGDDWTR